MFCDRPNPDWIHVRRRSKKIWWIRMFESNEHHVPSHFDALAFNRYRKNPVAQRTPLAIRAQAKYEEFYTSEKKKIPNTIRPPTIRAGSR